MAVAAGTAVNADGDGGKPLEGDEGELTTMFQGSGPGRALSGNVHQTSPKSNEFFHSHQGVTL
eukprot:3923876-Prymnesium_polylepis.1